MMIQKGVKVFRTKRGNFVSQYRKLTDNCLIASKVMLKNRIDMSHYFPDYLEADHYYYGRKKGNFFYFPVNYFIVRVSKKAIKEIVVLTNVNEF